MHVDDNTFAMLNDVNVEDIRWNNVAQRRKIKLDTYSRDLKELIEWCSIATTSLNNNCMISNEWRNMDRVLTTGTLDDYLLDGRYELTVENLVTLNDLTREIKDYLTNPTYANLHDYCRRVYFCVLHDLIAFKTAVQKL